VLARALRAGRGLPATLAAPSGRERGGLVPRGALLRYQGGLWAYRAEPVGGYRRIELTDARAESGGWFVRDGLKPGDRVAADGIAVLLSIEHGGEPAGEDD
jgi:multidrug efflux pump subunit AcrA (membrane-fusion protein)